MLDEPTTGLDPNQLVEIRALIKEIGKEKTVLFSTHILPEVEAICQRVLILKEGKLVADRSVEKMNVSDKKNITLVVELKNNVRKSDWIELGKEIEINQINHGCFSIVTRTVTRADYTHISTRTISNLWSNFAEQFSYRFFVFQVDE